MPRQIVVALIFVVVVVGGAALLLLGGGGGDDSEPTTTTVATPAPAATPAPEEVVPAVEVPPAVAATADGEARFEAWAEPLRAAGLVVENGAVSGALDTLVVDSLSIAGPADDMSWRWASARVRVTEREDGKLLIVPDGLQTLTIGAVTLAVTADSFEIVVGRTEGVVSEISLAFEGLSIASGEGESTTLRSGSIVLAVAAGDDPLPAQSVADVRLTGLRMADNGGSFGPTIDRLNFQMAFDRPVAEWSLGEGLRPWMGEEQGVTLSAINLAWGTLELTGEGMLALDGAGRPAGQFEAAVTDPLTVLEAINVVRPFQPADMAAVFAGLLEEIGEAPGDPVPVTLVVSGGNIVLRGEPWQAPDLTVGTVGPLLAPAVP